MEWHMELEHSVILKAASTRAIGKKISNMVRARNIGTIIRSSLFFNCNAIINTINGGSSENGSLVKAASGAFEEVHYMQVTNITQTIIKLKKLGYIIIGLDETSTEKIPSFRKGNDDIAIVFGAEGKGIRRLTKEYCDMLLSIDGNHKFSSLNVSAAVGITLFNIQFNRPDAV